MRFAFGCACALLVVGCSEDSVLDPLEAGSYVDGARNVAFQMGYMDPDAVLGAIVGLMSTGPLILMPPGVSGMPPGVHVYRPIPRDDITFQIEGVCDSAECLYTHPSVGLIGSVGRTEDHQYSITIGLRGMTETGGTWTSTLDGGFAIEDLNPGPIADSQMPRLVGELRSVTQSTHGTFGPDVSWDVLVSFDLKYDYQCRNGVMNVSTVYEDDPNSRNNPDWARGFDLDAVVDLGPGCLDATAR